MCRDKEVAEIEGLVIQRLAQLETQAICAKPLLTLLMVFCYTCSQESSIKVIKITGSNHSQGSKQVFTSPSAPPKSIPKSYQKSCSRPPAEGFLPHQPLLSESYRSFSPSSLPTSTHQHTQNSLVYLNPQLLQAPAGHSCQLSK